MTDDEYENQIVWFRKGGAVYHRTWCPCLTRSCPLEMVWASIDQACGVGERRPCKVCKPVELSPLQRHRFDDRVRRLKAKDEAKKKQTKRRKRAKPKPSKQKSPKPKPPKPVFYEVLNFDRAVALVWPASPCPWRRRRRAS